MGGTSFAYDDERAVLSDYLQRNIYTFSAAKSLVQMKQYRDLMIGRDGKLLEFPSFKKLLANQGEIFNQQYLKAEYECAKYSAIMAHKWDTLDSEYLEYSTVGDRRVRPEHRMLDKFTARKDHPVWDKIYPIKAWGCRCTVVPGKGQNVGKVMGEAEAARMMKPLIKDTIFDNNVGKTRVIFNDNHPYFQKVGGKVSQLSWEQYGMQPLDKIRMRTLPQFKAMSETEYFAWWSKQGKLRGDDIVIKDVLGQEIMLPSGEGKKGKADTYFKHHLLRKSDERRYQYGAQAGELLRNPDELWLNENKDRVYVKYYEKGAIKLIVEGNRQAKTMFLIEPDQETELKRARKGVLLHRK